jgi:hypothetical protein
MSRYRPINLHISSSKASRRTTLRSVRPNPLEAPPTNLKASLSVITHLIPVSVKILRMVTSNLFQHHFPIHWRSTRMPDTTMPPTITQITTTTITRVTSTRSFLLGSVLLVAFLLASCGSDSTNVGTTPSSEAAAQPTVAPIIIYETVVVTATPTATNQPDRRTLRRITHSNTSGSNANTECPSPEFDTSSNCYGYGTDSGASQPANPRRNYSDPASSYCPTDNNPIADRH